MLWWCLCPSREFKARTKVETVVVVWTATTERFCDILEGVNDTKANLLAAVQADHSEIAPSTLYALACVHEKVPFVNGSPQNTFVPGENRIRNRSLLEATFLLLCFLFQGLRPHVGPRQLCTRCLYLYIRSPVPYT